MAKVVFTRNLERHVACPPREVAGARTVAEALAEVFAELPRLRDYVVDEQGELRQHMVVFVDGQPIGDRRTLSDPVREGSEVYVMQALSGG